VLGGVDLADWPLMFPKDAERSSGSADGMVTNVFGRTALVRRMPTTTEAGRDVFVAFDGAPLEMMQRSALWLLMSFLAGRWGAVVGTIGIEGDREIWRRRHRWTAPSAGASPPMDSHRWNQIAHELPQRFPGMLDNALALLKEEIPLDVALEHLFANSRGYLDIEIRDIALALDSLVEANAFSVGDAYVIDPDEYEDLVPSIELAISDALKDVKKADDLQKRLMERIKGANDVSHGERRRKFWKRVGFDLKPDEKDALDNRNPMSHAGYILRHTGTEEYQALINQVRLARNLVNRVVFALLGYEGALFDYTSGLTKPWNYFLERDGSRKKKK